MLQEGDNHNILQEGIIPGHYRRGLSQYITGGDNLITLQEGIAPVGYVLKFKE